MSSLYLIASIWQPNAFSLVTEHAGWVETLSTIKHRKCTEGNVFLTATLCLFVAMLHGYLLFTFGLADFPLGTQCSYTKQWETYRASSPFSSLCCVLFFIFFLFFSSGLHRGGAKGHIWLILFRLEGFAILLQDKIITNGSSQKYSLIRRNIFKSLPAMPGKTRARIFE